MTSSAKTAYVYLPSSPNELESPGTRKRGSDRLEYENALLLTPKSTREPPWLSQHRPLRKAPDHQLDNESVVGSQVESEDKPEDIARSTRDTRSLSLTKPDKDRPGKDAVSHTHDTRSVRTGRKPAYYDQKYHPMDAITQPKRAAKRLSHTDIASLPGTASLGKRETRSDSSMISNDSESDVDSCHATHVKPVRRSKRTENKKMVNYSTKHHPQDSSIPGYQHLARACKAGTPPMLAKRSRQLRSVESDAEDSDNMPFRTRTRHTQRIPSCSDSDDLAQSEANSIVGKNIPESPGVYNVRSSPRARRSRSIESHMTIPKEIPSDHVNTSKQNISDPPPVFDEAVFNETEHTAAASEFEQVMREADKAIKVLASTSTLEEHDLDRSGQAPSATEEIDALLLQFETDDDQD